MIPSDPTGNPDIIRLRPRTRPGIRRPGLIRWRLAVFATLPMVMTPAHAITIEEVFAVVLRSNPSVLAARDAARSVHEQVPRAAAAWLPVIRTEAGSAFQKRYDHPSQRGAISRQNSLSLVYVHNFYRGGGDQAALRRAEAEVLRSHAGVEDTEQQVLLSVATVYQDVIRAERAIELRKASLAAFEERVRQTRAQYDAGDRTRADLALAEAERDVAAADLVSAEADLDIQRARFETLVGMAPDGLEAAGMPADLPETLEAARRAARQARPTVRAAAYAVRAARQAVRTAEAERGPSVDLSSEVSRTFPGGTVSDGHEYNDLSVRIQLSLPLFEGGAVDARVRQAEHILAQRRNELYGARREALQRATSAWRRLSAARERHAALSAAVEASRVALAGIRREGTLGERTTREELDAERDLVSRQVRALSTKRDAIVAAYELLEATGALTASRLAVKEVPDLSIEMDEIRNMLSLRIATFRMLDHLPSVDPSEPEAANDLPEATGAPTANRLAIEGVVPRTISIEMDEPLNMLSLRIATFRMPDRLPPVD